MTTDVLNEPRCATQDLPYDSVREPVLRSTSSPATITKTASTVLGTPSISGTTTTTPTTTTNSRRMKYSTQTNLSTPRSSASSMHQRHAGPTDILSILRSIALKPFRTASMNEAVAGGHTSNVIGGSTSHNRTPVNLLRYRPLSDALIDQNPYAQSTRVCITRLRFTETFDEEFFVSPWDRRCEYHWSMQMTFDTCSRLVFDSFRKWMASLILSIVYRPAWDRKGRVFDIIYRCQGHSHLAKHICFPSSFDVIKTMPGNISSIELIST